MGLKTYAQQNRNDSARIARQRVSDSTKHALQQRTDSMRAARQQVLDSSRQVTKRRTDSLAAIRKYKESRRYTDSVTKMRQAAMEATKAARAQVTDSIKAVRKQALDSTLAARKRVSDSLQRRMKARSDSLTAITRYKNSKRYRDSVERARNRHIDSMRNSRIAYTDSVKAVRKHSLDSTIAARKKVTDSMRARQKVRADSMAAIRKYKESKRYRDSVSVTRQMRLDSITTLRKRVADSVMAIRKASLDSAKAARKKTMDSTMAVRKKTMDSLKLKRELRADSLAKAKELREKNQKAQLKKREDKAKMAFEMKIKKKHEAYSNEKMLKKKWTILRQAFQNTYTRYNYYFNAKRKMIEAQENMVRRKKDDFEQVIPLFPFDPNLDSTVFASDMDTIVRKVSVGIQIHDPRTKWADDLYLLMGQAFYYKGNYESAVTTFRYIVGMKNRNLKKKKKNTKKKEDGSLVQKEKSRIGRLLQHKPAHNDAVLWLTRTFTDSKRDADAEAILDLLDASSGLSNRMKAQIALEKANLQVRRGAYKEASRQLDIVIASKNIAKYTRQRAAFLNGQLLYNMGEYTAASASYQKALNLHPQIDMDFYARKNMAGSIALSGGDQTRSIASLKSILKDGKYAPYHEQVYFLLGQLSANEGRDGQALEYYRKSLSLPKTSKKQKAVTYAAMGNIHYRGGAYNLAKRAYDSASYFAKGAGDNPELSTALRRVRSLDKIEEPYTMMVNQDSLLRLAAMNEKDQRAAVKRYLRYLQKTREDSLNKAQNSGTAAAEPVMPGGGASSWYFSSQATVQQGYNDFRRKWGSRPLSDNWRRASASSYGSEVVGLNNGEDSTAEADAEDGLPTEASLMAAIPHNETQLKEVRRKLRKAYISLSDAYIRNLEDYPAGVQMLDTLDHRFPDHEYGDHALSLRYLAALRQNQPDTAERYRQRLLSSYPNSSFAKTLAPQLNESDSSMPASADGEATVAEYYQETYRLSDERQYTEVLQHVSIARRKYGDANYARKFTILEASSLAGLGDYKKADTIIKGYLKEYPSDSLKPWADAISKRIEEMKAADTLRRDSTAATALVDTALKTTAVKTATDSLANAKSALPEAYSYKPAEAHFVIFLFGKPDAKIAGFKSGLSDFGTIKFSGLKLAHNLDMIGPERSMVTSRAFANAGQARIFMKAALAEQLLFRELEKGSYQAYIISETNYAKLVADKNPAAYNSFYNKYYK